MCCSSVNFLWMRSILGVTLLAVGGLAYGMLQADEPQKPSISEQTKVESKLLRHVVLFKFKESSSEADVKQVVDAFRELPKKITGIAEFEWGINNSPEGLNDGLTHGFIVTFKTEKDRDVYLTHPAHMAFVEVLKPHLDRPLVVDFWASK